ncbi:hypothetical protein B0T26DRAFT_807478 [Lasiosphaeria miniovina]|uniref:Ribosomal RNA methyltransferase FtsJ domain-containing protein n=1 Tax=Lasiosphaeria miniovina TaxID=1954250 RepID=A0AA39ZV29_9PEZI|nr:uncharacterized protein B0T26DRAFT_807478 [Lasiosphaeria miniovina]KAK0704079.1 hypothetical protein B0T26DRAFT_807478 [Lasiosphaeria miniovina]
MRGTLQPIQHLRLESLPNSPSEETKQTESAKALIQSYLRQHLAVYRELCEVREACQENEECEAYFQKQRSRADHAIAEVQKGFFSLMRTIGLELDKATSALTIQRRGKPRPAILDLCLAPGGFSLAALQRNGWSTIVRGISLPPEQGGHKVHLRNVSSEDNTTATKFVDYRDITLLAEEMGVPLSKIPASHPDRDLFSSYRPYLGRKFDLVFCDGQVLRTHERGKHRQEDEALRLLTSQLVLALQRIRSGGTMMILLHGADKWPSMRSSFYLIVKGVKPGREAAVQAVERWKVQWKLATFENEVMNEREWEVLGGIEGSAMEAEAVLKEFGSELLRLAEPVFAVQAEALKQAPWMSSAKGKGKEKEKGEEKNKTLDVKQEDLS